MKPRLPGGAHLKQLAGLAGLYGVLVVSLSLNVWLGWRLKGSPSVRALKRGGVQESTHLVPIPVVDARNQHTYLNFDSKQQTVLYVLSPGCSWCKRNAANIKTLASAEGTGYRFVGISNTTDGFADYIKSSGLPFPLYAVESTDTSKKFGLDVTPQTVLIDSGGVVLKVWVGAFNAETQKQVESLFNLKLPGLLELPQSH